MTTFNKILKTMYSTIASYSIADDNSINVKYVVGIGDDNEGVMTNFIPVISEYKYISSEDAKGLLDNPLGDDTAGKTLQEVMIQRIYEHLKDTDQIIV